MRVTTVLSWSGCILVALGACGGRVESEGSGGSSGSGAAAGSGAVAGSGAAAGTGAVAGSGATAGTGGTSGVGATGGTAGTAGGGGTPSSLHEQAAKVCEKINQTACPLPGCKQELTKAINEAVSAGCAEELSAVLDCALKFPLVCKYDEPELSPMCSSSAEALEKCMGAVPPCSVWGSSDGSCGLACGYFDVTCKPDPAGGLSCVCDAGPSAGKMFKLPGSCNSPGFQDAVTNVCG